MAGTSSGRTTRTTARESADTASAPATGREAARPAPAPTPPVPEPSPRTGVAVNVASAQTAFASGDASQTVGYVQHVLRSRGFDPGNFTGTPDHATRVAFAKFQQSIGLEPTGVPDERTLDYLGFDVIG